MTNTFFYPVIDAQHECLESIKRIARKMEALYEILKLKGIVSKYTVLISPYNTGYEVKANAVFNYDNYKKENEAIYTIANAMECVFLQPETFYNDLYIKGMSKLEGFYFDPILKKREYPQIELATFEWDEPIIAAARHFSKLAFTQYDEAIKIAKEIK
jgi:hypothetical protein